MTTETPRPSGSSTVPASTRFSLGAILREAREKADLRQNALADLMHLQAPTLSNFENGQRVPSMSQLAQFSEFLKLDLQTLVLARLYEEVRTEDVSNWPSAAQEQRPVLALNLQQRVVESLRAVGNLGDAKLQGRTFLDFPDAFPDIVVVTGDRREEPPKNAGDIGAYSASPVDDRWLMSLNLPSSAQKVSDKEFVLSSREQLCKRYGNRTLLVVGSPAANHLARIICPGAVFRFNLQSALKDELEGILQTLRTEKDREELERKKREYSSRLKTLMRTFFAYGIMDPMLGDVRGFALVPDVDYATITFAVNPYSDPGDHRHVAILVAGFHHPGTAWALRCLSGP